MFKERAHKGGADSGKYIRIKDGEKVDGVLRGNVHEFHIKWESNKSREVAASEPGAKSRFKVNVVVFEDGRFIAKMFEFGIVLYDHLYEISKNMDLSKTKLRISRKGVGTDSVYLPVPLGPVDERTLAAIAKVELNILDAKKPQATHLDEFPSDFGEPPPEYDSEIPF